MKKIFALFLTTVMSLNMFSAIAKEDVNSIETKIQRVVSDDEYKLLETLDLVSDEEYAYGDYLTRAEFCKILCRLFNLTKYENTEIPFRDIDKTHLLYPEVTAAYKNNMIRGISTYVFAPDRAITVEEAVIMLISGLGLGSLAEIKNITYTSYAQQIKLTKGISVKLSDSLDEQNAYKLMYNTLFSYPLQWEDSSSGMKFSVSDEYLIEKLYGITEVCGIVTETPQSSLYDGGTIENGFICLNGIEYVCSDEDLNNLLGYAVKAYVAKDEKNGYDEIVCANIDDRKSKEITVLSKDIEEISETYAKITENNRIQTIKIRDGFDLIYNGMGVKNHDNVKPEYGEMKLVDNTGDGVYDVVFVKDYKVISVKTFSNDGKLLQIVGDDGSVFAADISEPECIVKVYLNDDSQSTSKTDMITSGSVLLVADSGVGDNRLIEIRKFSNSESGVVNSVSDDSITLEGKSYSLCPLVDNSEAKKCVGNIASVYFDNYGNVICVKKEISGKAYGYLYKGMYIEEDEEYMVEILNTDNEWHKYRLCEKIHCNGDKLKAEILYKNLLILNADGNEVVKKQPVRFEIDANGKLKRLDIAEYSTAPDGTIDIDNDDYLRKNDYFRKSRGYAKRTYNHDASAKGLFVSNMYDTWCECFFTKDLKVLVHPNTQEVQKEEIKFETRSYFSVTGQYYCEIYDIDEENSTPLVEILAEAKPKVTHKAKYIAVDRIVMGLDEDDMPVQLLYGYEGGAYTVYEAAEDDSFKFNGRDLQRGDLVRVILNTLGKVDSIEKYSTNLLRFRVDSDPTKYFTDYDSVGNNVNAFGYQYNQTVVGRVDRAYGNYVRVAVKNGKYIHAMLESTSIMVFDRDEGKQAWRKGTKNDIALNDVIFIQMFSGKVNDVFVYKL